MADELPSPAGQRFSEDLRRIREERGISIGEVHSETQIPETLIDAFEEGRLYDHSSYNRVYLRSFVRAYADALNISREAALSGLDAALEGTYDRALADRYLSTYDPEPESPIQPEPQPGESQSEDASSEDGPSEHQENEPSERNLETPEPSQRPSTLSDESAYVPTAGGPEGRGGIVGPPREVGESSPESESEDSSVPDAADVGGTESPTEPETQRSSPGSSEPQARDEPDDEDVEERETPDRPHDDLPSWSGEGDPEQPDPSPAGSTEREGGGDLSGTGIVGEPTELGSDASAGDPHGTFGPSAASSEPPGSSRSRRSATGWQSLLPRANRQLYVIGAGIVVVLLVLLGLGVAYFSTEEAPEREATVTAGGVGSATPAPPDTTEHPAPSPPADVTIGTTINLTVFATGSVNPIRIRRDDDLRRPYWIEEGTADVFPFEEEVTLENQLSDVRLYLEGYPYPFQPQDTLGGLRITRSQVQAFVDTLRGAPPTLSVSPDTIPAGTLPQ